MDCWVEVHAPDEEGHGFVDGLDGGWDDGKVGSFDGIGACFEIYDFVVHDGYTDTERDSFQWRIVICLGAGGNDKVVWSSFELRIIANPQWRVIGDIGTVGYSKSALWLD